jgi:GAF domain-containing protein
MSDAGRDDPVSYALLDLHRALAERETTEQTLSRIAEIGARAVPGCDMLSVTATDGGGARTVAHWGDDPTPIDRAQYEADRGPCLDAMRAVARISIDDVATDTRWPEFRRAALEQGVAGSLSLPITAAGQTFGSINMYSRSTIDADSHVADLFAEQAAIALYNATITEHAIGLADDLRRALITRDLIGQAKGVLMHQRRVGAGEAFDLLRIASQRSNRKLRDIALDVAETGALPDDVR